jgi:hypothetical protein
LFTHFRCAEQEINLKEQERQWQDLALRDFLKSLPPAKPVVTKQ